MSFKSIIIALISFGKKLGRCFRQKFYIMQWRTAREQQTYKQRIKSEKFGVNVVSFFRATKGLSVAALSSIKALKVAQIPYTIVDCSTILPHHQLTQQLPESPHGTEFKYPINLLHLNPPELRHLWKLFSKSDLSGRYNIGVWYWELPELPQDWLFAFDLVDEVWAASQFIMDSISAVSPVPVVKIPPCIEIAVDRQLKRSDFDLPDDKFLFFCAYDVLSINARKNPMGAVMAFKRAFSEDNSSVGLVIRINNANENQSEIDQLRQALSGYKNVYFIENRLSKSHFNTLLSLIDVVVSLHRSEGFGLIPAEAMSLGKPVIMTRWSGNLDLMTTDNSCGVDYKLIRVVEKSGPYLPGQIWAEPDIDHAAFYMKKLRSDKLYYSQISKQAKKFISDHFSPEGIGKLIKERIDQIGLL